ncbi:DNA repair protein RAD52 homolog [Microplitis demolitor]|uniref:DNA repair protein RAD52 homolog n=1 Tax=Microplitis demolitor TaxID=69319 RepID=UPI00235B624F|nr:DNA repair protein RAD52 homolog [Microplitis demolitor]
MAVNHYDLEFLLEQANKLFSRDNWAHEIIDQTIDFVNENNKIVYVGCSTVVRVLLKSGRFHENVGFHEGVSESTGKAFEDARKISYTDALYRTLLSFEEFGELIIKIEEKKKRLEKQKKLKNDWIKKNMVEATVSNKILEEMEKDSMTEV